MLMLPRRPAHSYRRVAELEQQLAAAREQSAALQAAAAQAAPSARDISKLKAEKELLQRDVSSTCHCMFCMPALHIPLPDQAYDCIVPPALLSWRWPAFAPVDTVAVR